MLKKKLIAIIAAAGIGGGTLAGFVGAGINETLNNTETANIEEIEDGYYDILHTLNRNHNNKVVDIIDVTTSSKTVKEGEADVEKGVVKVYATAVTAKGKEYVGSFTYTGDKTATDAIDMQSSAVYTKVTVNSEDKANNEEIVKSIISYVHSVADFVEENANTCEFVQEDLNTSVLQESTTAEDGTVVTSNYTGAGLLDRYLAFLGQKGITALKEYDKFKADIEPFLENKTFTTNIKIDIENQTAIVFTNLNNLTFRLTLDVSSAIQSTEPEKIKAEVSEYVLKFLQATPAEATNSLNIIQSAATIDISSNTIWTSINELTNASLATPENTLE